ncbi:MAG: type I-C CRISPR-associated protein Cas8c/Csd1, partial [Roseiflexaceae bacterium]|nr:type I-C CRISPR-associated protein Cas8c/Csd1 [Roseiflexaceae bacterium]
TLGIGGEDAKPDRVAACHADYRDILDRCAAATNEPDLRAIQQFYADGGAALLTLPADFDSGAWITFRVDGLFPTALVSVQAFWAAEHDLAAKGAQTMQCIVCGHERPVLSRLQGKVKGVPGGQMSGTSIISANSTAFESYGLEASLIAPTCADCGERFTKAVNELLSNEQHRIIIGGAAFLFWTREDVPFDFGTALNKPEAAQVKALIDSMRTGKHMPIDDTAFYATSLSGSGARVVVRDWIDTTVGDAKNSLGRWFQLQAITDDRGQLANPLGIYALAGATVREMKDLPTTTPRALLHAALTGTPLPMSLLYQAVRRSRAEQGVTRQRAALIKLVLLSHEPSSKEATMIDLDQNHPDPAYHCGRLLAVLADIQEAAIGKAAIVDRFYGTASSAPASVFGRLLRGAQPHIAKLERDRRNVAVALQRRLEGVMSSLESFPKILTLEQQGLFALGFYHQRAYDRAQMYANAARKQAAATASTDTTNTGELFPNDEAE